MPPPLPVPSKAAIHALRGLALGTSCAIGVIVEDRRRRISTLRTAISNKEKLKGSRHYHGTLEYGTLPLDTDDAVLLNSNDLQWRERAGNLDDRDESISKILSTQDEERLDRALAKFFTSPETSYMLEHVGDAWLEISARLSKECQMQRRWEDAGKVLGHVLRCGRIEESWYYAHDPIPIIESYLPPESSNIQCSLDAFSKALRLFLATFTEKPEINRPEVEHIGRRLLGEALALKQFSRIDSIYWRVLVQLDDGSHFTAWVIKALSEHYDYKNVVKYFLLNFSKMSPNNTLFNETVDRVVYAVETMQGLKAALVFRAYARMVNVGDGSLRTRWIMRLLQAHWQRHRKFSRSKELFDEARTLGLLNRVAHPQGIYRVMVEIAIRADELAVANSYYDELVQLYPEMASDIPLKGYFAVARAKAGDWDGVYEDFMEMQPNRRRQQEEYNEAFIMVLKVFVEDHPVAEVRDFVTRYTRDLHVGMHRYMVTLVANKYGQCHDMSGFLAWLEYCDQAGFSLDPVFCNAVLHNCRTRWKFGFDQLKHLVSKMRQLNSSATDDTTERILSQAARAAGGTKMGSRRIHRKAISISKPALVGRSTNNRDVYEAMNQDIGCGKHTAAISIYRRAMRFGMPFCSHCFRLAVTAALELPGRSGPGPAFGLIHNAYEQGQDVSSAVSVFIRVHMDRFRAGTSDVLQHIQNLIARFEALHIVIDPAVLTHAALVCIKLGQHGKAISLCHLAMKRSGNGGGGGGGDGGGMVGEGGGNPCFSRQSFRALLLAYTQTLDVDGLEYLLAALFEQSDFSFERKTLLALRSALKEVRTYRRDPAAVAVEDLVRRAVAEVKALRVEKMEEGRVISQETLRIMGDALADFQGAAPIF
ncbi:hypothetical protein UCREL1_10240 [Eutypa lata UCREL1]|uniref:Pentatricopeptide repeat protein n=1 Tax=Eutypa lata (strain UCR-EL1) TaxID=1287681 RepID=M7SF68_EUTLA|nr:hypothetical protein UCREL1_10240 [Eutypa lata UCREL1]